MMYTSVLVSLRVLKLSLQVYNKYSSRVTSSAEVILTNNSVFTGTEALSQSDILVME